MMTTLLRWRNISRALRITMRQFSAPVGAFKHSSANF
jgi:hypothetical protein